MPLEPLNSKLVILRDTLPPQNPNGLIVPEETRKHPNTCTILAVGPDVKNTVALRVGSKIVAMPHAGIMTQLPEEEIVFVIDESELLGVAHLTA